jgi:hypothetical protein
VTARTTADFASATTRNPPAADQAMPRGTLKSAPAPTPSCHPSVPLTPAIVLTELEASAIARITCDAVETKRVPVETTSATPTGALKDAAVPAPSTHALVALPAIVVTTPVASASERMRLFKLSAKKITPSAAEIARPIGFESATFVPMPSPFQVDTPVPASVVTLPATSRRRRLVDWSSVK